MKKKGKSLITQLIIVFTVVLITVSCKKDNSDSFKDKPIKYGSLTDIDSNTYKTMCLGKQTWMAENLRTTRYNDDSVIPVVTDKATWDSLKTAAVCTYKNTVNTDSINYNGRLYNWYAVNTGKLCPKGWHVPSDAEWTDLENYLISERYNYDSSTTENKLGKSLATKSGWNTSSKTGVVGNNQLLNNRTGYTGTPSGARLGGGNFGDYGVVNYLWCRSEMNSVIAICRYLVYDDDKLGTSYNNKSFGYSVRCIKD